jgi:hypothetical protein
MVTGNGSKGLQNNWELNGYKRENTMIKEYLKQKW